MFDLRKDAGYTQDKLADILKINKHSISSYERDKSEPPDAIKIAIAQLFQVSVDYLLGLTDIPNSYKDSRNVLFLPSDFPDSAKSSLNDYVEFLQHKYTTQKKQSLL